MKSKTQRDDISRRTFLATSGMALAASTLFSAKSSQASETKAPAVATGGPSWPFELTPLPYPADALEPAIDAMTMEIHHGKHFAGYTKKLNAALETVPPLQDQSIESLLGNLETVPADVRTAVRNNGGGYFNHALFWTLMSPEGGGEPRGPLADAINRDFGGLEAFEETFNHAAATRFGSGWAWLVVTDSGALQVGSTPNQDNPLMAGVSDLRGTPILGLDVWEHAYYLKYQNRRKEYISNWWSILDWRGISNRFETILS